MSDTDLELLARYARHRAEDAFAEVVRRHLDLVYSAARRQVRAPELAEEVAQAVFADLARQANQLPPRTVLAAWLYQVTRRTAIDVVRREASRRLRERVAHELHAMNANVDDWTRIESLLDEAMHALDDTDRTAVLLRYFENKPLREIGAALGTSDDAAQKRVSRAVERLREFFSKRGVTVGASGLVVILSTNAVQAAPAGMSASMSAAALNAAASATTNLTMIKSGVELLAMTKAKAAILAGVCAAIIIGAVLVYEPRQPDPGSRLRLPVGKGIPAVEMGSSHGLILASDGSLWSWGTNFAGWPVLGLGKIQTQKSLHRIGSDTDWTGISSSSTHSLALKADGSMWAWGDNLIGQLGRGTPPGRGDESQSAPVPSAPGNDWKQVAAGDSYSLALKQDGTLWAWGVNWAGNLGIGSSEKEVYEVTRVGTATNWTRVWAATSQSVGQQSDGSLWFWGSLTGSSEDTNRFFMPTRVSADTNWVDVGFGYFVVFAIKADGTLWAWGRNAGIYTGAPIEVLNPTPARVGTNTDWQACSSSEYFYHLLKKKDGSLWALDASDYSRENKASYRPIEFRRVKLQKEIVAFDAAGINTGVALTRDGEVWTWGRALGEYTPAWPKMQSLAKALGWKTERFESKPVIRDEPWLLPNTE